MSRSGYGEGEGSDTLNLYRANVDRSIRGRRGQSFLRELAAAMDAMPEKRLIRSELIRDDGEVCAIGVVCRVRSTDVSRVDIDDAHEVGKLVGIAGCLAAEIEYINDDDFGVERCSEFRSEERETPERRWTRVRKWVSQQIGEPRDPDALFHRYDVLSGT